MSSAISVLSSITGLIAVAEQIISTAKQLYESDEDAPGSIRCIKDEMQGLQELLYKVHSIILGKSESKPSHSRLAMISIHHLITVLSGCVLVSSRLGELLSQAVGIVKARANSSSNEGLERTGWIKWKEGDVNVVMEELQHYKSILEVMLNVIHCNSTSEARQSLVRLDELVAKTLDYKTPISLQLTELIQRQDPAVLEQSAAGQDSSSINTYDDVNDAVSIKTTTTAVGSVLGPGTFMDELKKSRPYKRLHHQGSSASVFSTTSVSTRGGRWSLLSTISLGDLSISEISVLELPICEADLWDPTPYRTSKETINRTEPPRPRWYIPRMMSILRRFETRIVGIAPYLNPNNPSISNELTPLIHAVFEGREAACLSLLKPETPPLQLRNVLNEAAVTSVHFRRLVHKSSTDICVKLFLLMAFGDDVGRCVRWVCKHLLVALEQGDNETARALLEHPQLQVDLIVNSASDFRFADLLSASPVATSGPRKTSKCGPIRQVLYTKPDLDKIPQGKWEEYFKSNSGTKGFVEAAHLLFLRFAHARTQTENAPPRPKDSNQNTIHPYYQDAIDIFAGNSAFESLRSSRARKNKDSGHMAKKSSTDCDKQLVYNPSQRCENSECLCTLLSNTRSPMEVQLGPHSGTSYSTSYDPKSSFNKDTGLDQAASNNCLRAAKLLLILGATPTGIEPQEKHIGSSSALAKIYGQNNPLLSAIENNNSVMVQLLLEGGAGAGVTLTQESKLALDHIQDREIFEMLRSAGEPKRSGNCGN